MIALSPPSFDITSPLVLASARLSDDLDLSRRVSRTATLDGGAEVSDMGHSHADRTLRVRSPGVSRAEAEAAAYLLRSYPSLIVATEEGLFLAAPEGLTVRSGELSLSLLVTEKLTED